ncbi:MAG: outer membrane protein OmpA-like peptidoglycan-associated protein [Paraglaciecola sp.]|jgi:outer membrane protein OmpA-like peptidoglycan-associated protein
MRFFVITILSSLFFTADLAAQGEPIVLQNPSFEDMPRIAKVPRGWYDCGFPTESEPDIQPSGSGSSAFFNVVQPAQDGQTYVGMVVRDNDTWEMIAQRLTRPMEGGKCYEFSLSLSRSEIYVSPSRVTGQEVNYTSPVKLRIWGGNGYCEKAELLAETPLIINTRWLEYNFKFEPTKNYSYIVLEAFYKTPILFPYNGNVLMDNASPIFPIPCDTEVPELPTEVPVLADNTPPTTLVTTPPATPKLKATPTQPNTPIAKTNPTPPKLKVLRDLDRMKEGETIRIDKLFFLANKTDPTEDSYEVLDEVYDFLAINKDMIVEIGGHTNTTPAHAYCDSLSTDRAKAVVGYLIRKGIASSRLQYRGYGKRKPLVYDKNSKANRLKNQRVEIKVLSFNG